MVFHREFKEGPLHVVFHREFKEGPLHVEFLNEFKVFFQMVEECLKNFRRDFSAVIRFRSSVI